MYRSYFPKLIMGEIMKILIALMLAIPMLAQASLSYEHYMSIVKGEYKIVFDRSESVFAEVIKFEINNKGEVHSIDNDLEAAKNTFFFQNDLGPIGLPYNNSYGLLL